MIDNQDILNELEAIRGRFVVTILVDLSNLYEIYSRIHAFAIRTNDAELLKTSSDLFKVFDDISNTATVKVFANGLIEMIKSGQVTTETTGDEPKS